MNKPTPGPAKEHGYRSETKYCEGWTKIPVRCHEFVYAGVDVVPIASHGFIHSNP